MVRAWIHELCEALPIKELSKRVRAKRARGDKRPLEALLREIYLSLSR